MPAPLLIIGIIAGVVGVGTAGYGAVKYVKAKRTVEDAQRRYARYQKRLESANMITTKKMDQLGKIELKAMKSFEEFQDVFEKIANRPYFNPYSKDGFKLPEYNGEKLKEVSIGAAVLLGGLGGAAAGTAGGIAAAGAVQAAVITFGTASTGTAIASLSGVAATNATLAFLGGGTLAAGGGGVAAGATALGVSTLGIGILVGGIIFTVVGKKFSEKADEAWRQWLKIKANIKKICKYLNKLYKTSSKYYKTFSYVDTVYLDHMNKLKRIIINRHNDWNNFTDLEKTITENTSLLVGLLYNMCKVEIVLQGHNAHDLRSINEAEVEINIKNAKSIAKETARIANRWKDEGENSSSYKVLGLIIAVAIIVAATWFVLYVR